MTCQAKRNPLLGRLFQNRGLRVARNFQGRQQGAARPETRTRARKRQFCGNDAVTPVDDIKMAVLLALAVPNFSFFYDAFFAFVAILAAVAVNLHIALVIHHIFWAQHATLNAES